ncbi:MAG: PQQ-binding-like beta-propeller repeat protein [Ferruginibacter sp.]|nr:PQQ-binding-like beta-propeller repeat protein [Cytophagales bacterium]
MRFIHPVFCLVGLLSLGACADRPENDQRFRQWTTYGGDPGSHRYSNLRQINVDNVSKLRVAWTYHTGERDTANRAQIQCNPIVVNGVLYATSSRISVLAIHAATGKPLWRFDPFTHWGGENGWAGTNRGVTYWESGSDKRILCSAGNYLFALDATTGQPIPTFGDNGRLDLQRDLDYHKEKFFIVANSPGIIYKDLIIMGMRLSEGLDAAPGHVRAFDVRTGKRAWIFHTIPYPGEPGHETWDDPQAYRRIGGANAWAGMSLDEARGIVFVPLGSATYDFWGGYRKGQNLYANCLVALDAATGKRQWHFQTVHHDLWDRDLPAPPNLVTVTHGGKRTDAVAQITKHGLVFLFDRVTGKPLFPIRETPVPPSDLRGEQAWPTQPIPTLPEPFMRQNFPESDIIDVSPEHHAEIAPQFRQLKSGGMFIPPSEQGAVLFPGFDGGGEWGGASFDPETGMLYVNANEMPWKVTMKENQLAPGGTLADRGQNLYVGNCANCHGADRKGNAGAYPSLVGLDKKYPPAGVAQLLKTGRGTMPSFKHLADADREALVAFLLNLKTEADPYELKEVAANEADDVPIPAYSMTGYSRFLTKDHYPAIKPPWGTLNAIDLTTGKLAWKVPLGEFAALTKRGISPTGTENYGGPVTTAGGLVFIGASKDEKFRAFDKRTGKVLWETTLPAGGYATPCVYEADGKQYVVIAAGGGKMGTKSGDAYVAFALPE